MNVSSSIRLASFCFLFLLTIHPAMARMYECQPSAPNADQEQLETLANALQPGDELIVHAGTYSQDGRRTVTVKGTPDRPIFNGTKRAPPCDVGAYETDNHEQNIGWRIEPGFRKTSGRSSPSTSTAVSQWRVADQPNLRQELENAPILKTESLGEPARGVNVWERWFVPNHDGKSWDLLQIYFKEYYGPTWLCAVDFDSGGVKLQRLADNHQFYLSGRALGFDGKYYIATPSRRTGSMDLFVYDPATNAVEERGEIVHGLGGEVRPLVVGPDARIYGTGTRGNQVGLYVYWEDWGRYWEDWGRTSSLLI